MTPKTDNERVVAEQSTARSVYMPENVWRELERIAAENDRTLSAECRRRLIASLRDG